MEDLLRLSLLPFLPAARLLTALLAAAPACGSGILMRFLPGDASGSSARYDVYRAEGPAGLPSKIGSLPAPAAADTLSFPDPAATKGRAYAYTVIAVDSSGAESEPSEPTWAGYPRLSLPDTLRIVPGSGPAFRTSLDAAADPLRGMPGAPVPSFSVEPFGAWGSSGLGSITYDTSARTLVLVPGPGMDAPLRAVVRAGYHGKFEDADTVVLVPASAPTALGAQRAAGPGAAGPGVFLSGGAAGWRAPAPGKAFAPFRYDPAGRRLRLMAP
jgi:hypothetical protein